MAASAPKLKQTGKRKGRNGHNIETNKLRRAAHIKTQRARTTPTTGSPNAVRRRRRFANRNNPLRERTVSHYLSMDGVTRSEALSILDPNTFDFYCCVVADDMARVRQYENAVRAAVREALVDARQPAALIDRVRVFLGPIEKPEVKYFLAPPDPVGIRRAWKIQHKVLDSFRRQVTKDQTVEEYLESYTHEVE